MFNVHEWNRMLIGDINIHSSAQYMIKILHMKFVTQLLCEQRRVLQRHVKIDVCQVFGKRDIINIESH